MRKHLCFFLFTTAIAISIDLKAQDVFWFEDFDNGATTRWTLENAPGSGTNPTPAGIVGLTYEVNNPIFDNFVINDRNTPELSGNIVLGQPISTQGAFVRGRHYDCSAPSDLPNPFVNTGAGANQSLHITAHPSCATLLYIGTPQSDDWNCISDPDNGDVQTKTEQIAFLNQNIDATGKCNIKLTADFYLGGDADGIKSHSTILYSIDAGVTWKIVEDNIKGCSSFAAASCNNWFRRSFEIPSDADNQPDLRIAFRWFDDGDIDNTGDYAMGASFNIDNVMLSSCGKPDVDFSSTIVSCKNATIFLNSTVAGTSSGALTNCFNTIPGCTFTPSYTWLITGPGTVIYVNGTSSTDANPQIQIDTDGSYTVSLSVSGTACGGDSVLVRNNYITVADCPPVANFIASKIIPCTAPTSKLDTVTFTNMSTSPTAAITTWAWTFNPATVTYVSGNSSSQNPQVTFDTPGTYEVSLQVTSSEGTNTLVKTAYIDAITCECGGGGGGGAGVFWSEDFDGTGNWGAVNVIIGVEGSNPNVFYSSSVGSGTDNDLHISADAAFGGDLGYVYVEFGFGGFTNTNRRSISNSINTTGKTALNLNFSYFGQGDGASDDGFVEYSIDNGASWITFDAIPKAASYTSFSKALPVSCENITTLKIAFHWVNLDPGTGATDPPFAIDDITIDGTGGGGSSPNRWEGVTSTNWNTASNWSDVAVPTATTDVLIPSSVDLVGTFMPTISAAAVAQNVCNFGTITLTGNNTLTIDVDLLNEGIVTSTTVTNTADVIFANLTSIYRGSGTMYDIDVSVTSGNLTLETNLIARSLNIATTGTVDLATFQLSINKNLTKTGGTFIATNGVINFINACGSCVDATSNALVTLNANQAFGNVFVNKTAGVVTGLMSNVNHTFTSPKTLTIQSGILDANTNTVNGTGNLTMTGGEFQLAKCATVIPELTGNYTFPAGQVTFDGVCNQITKTSSGVTATTVFFEDFESPNIANGAAIAGNIPVWIEVGTSAVINFINDEASGLTNQTANVRHDWDFTPAQVEILSYGPIDFGVNTTNPQLTFDYENNDNSGIAQVRVEVLYKSTFASGWTIGAIYNHTTPSSINIANVVALAGASSTFYIGFRVSILDAGLGADGEVSIDNIIITGEGAAPVLTYYDIEFTGTNIKSLDNANLNIGNQLILTLPIGTGHYINTGTDTVNVLNNSVGIVSRTGGHIVGYLSRAITANGGIYPFYVGSDNADAETYYEPIAVTPQNISGATAIIANFNDASPNPAIVSPFITFGFAPTQDTIEDVEDEGFWQLNTNNPLTAGSYEATASPDIRFWSFTKVWGSGQYTLLKQSAIAIPWDYTSGGVRVNDSTTTSFSNFSNFALGFAKNNPLPDPLPVELITYKGVCDDGVTLLSWATASEINADFFILEKSNNGKDFTFLKTIPASGNSNETRQYSFEDYETNASENYYRLSQQDFNGAVNNYGIVFVSCEDNVAGFEFEIFPNPTAENLNLNIFSSRKENVTITIYDLLGNLVHKRDFKTIEKGVNIKSVALSQLVNGSYIINAKTERGESKNLQLIIVR